MHIALFYDTMFFIKCKHRNFITMIFLFSYRDFFHSTVCSIYVISCRIFFESPYFYIVGFIFLQIGKYHRRFWWIYFFIPAEITFFCIYKLIATDTFDCIYGYIQFLSGCVCQLADHGLWNRCLCPVCIQCLAFGYFCSGCYFCASVFCCVPACEGIAFSWWKGNIEIPAKCGITAANLLCI